MKKILFLFPLLVTLCSCGNNQEKKTNEKTPSLKASITLNSIEESFETHTDYQLSYFSSTEFASLPSSGRGSGDNSLPKSLELSWNISSEETIEKAYLLLSENESMSDPISYSLNIDSNGNVQQNKSITNLKVGANYYWQISLEGQNKSAKSSVENFSTKDTGPRFISIDGVTNVRDIGGWKAGQNKRVKQGLIYRGGEFNKQNYGKGGSPAIDEDSIERAKEKPYGMSIKPDGINTVLNELKIKTEIDVRGYENYEYIDEASPNYLNPSPVEIGGLTDGRGVLLDLKYIVNPIDTNSSKIYKTDGGKAAVKKFFSTLADEANYPVYFHCSKGKDRTGFVAYLLEGLLGVSKEDLCRDYVSSNFASSNNVKLADIANINTPSSGGNNYDYVAYFDGYSVSGMSSLSGTTIQERVAEYLLSCGLTQAQLDEIVRINLE